MARLIGLIAAIAGLAGVAGDEAAADMFAFTRGDAVPRVLWATPIGEIDEARDEVDGISVDPAGNTVISGVFRGRIVFGDKAYSSRGEGDVFVASYDVAGHLRWAQHLGSTGDDNTFDVATDGAGNIFLSGWFADSLNVGGATLRSRGHQDMFVVKLDADGNLIWARSFGGEQGDGGNEIAVLAGGDIAVSAMSNGDFVVDDQVFRGGGGTRDAYAIRLDPEGQVVWVHAFHGPGTERIRAISINEAGEVFLGFQYRGSVESQGMRVTSRGGWDGAAAKLNREGDLEWLLPVGGKGTDNVRGIGAAPDGSVYISGVIRGPAFMIDREIPAIGKRLDDFIVKLSSDGEPIWAVSFGGPGRNIGGELEVDARGVIASAVVEGEVTIRRNRKVLGKIEPPGGLPTSYIAGFTPEGRPRFIYMPTSKGSGAGALGDVLAISRDGRLLAQALRFRGSIEIGGTMMSTPSRVDSAVILFDLNGA